MNGVHLIGRLTRDPAADHTPSGKAVTTFRVAIDRPGHDGADFVTIKTWDRLAQVAAEHLVVGRRVAVQGRLAHEEWTGSDGRRAERLVVVADRIEFLDARPADKPLAQREGQPCEVGAVVLGELADRDPESPTQVHAPAAS